MRNHALDFMKITGCCIRVSELSEYCAFVKLTEPSEKQALHKALTEKLGAVVQERWFWRIKDSGFASPFKERCYMGICWNWDGGFPDFEEFSRQAKEVNEYTPIIGV
jgi:hypothetical protein